MLLIQMLALAGPVESFVHSDLLDE